MSETLENSAEHQEFVAENIRNQKVLTSLSRCLETAKVKHVGERGTAVLAIRAKLEAAGTTWKVSDRNWVVPLKADQPQNLQSLVDELLQNDPNIGDRASVAEAVQSGALAVESRSDLRTSKEKSDFITRFGYEKWAALPTVRTAPFDMNPATMGRKAYNSMTIAQKIAFQKLDAVTEAVLGQILRRP
jgi:hypothetical protein